MNKSDVFLPNSLLNDINSTNFFNSPNETVLGKCDKEGPCKTCHYALNMPKYVPKMIGCGLAFLFAIVVFILYLVEERRKEKHFYYNNKNQENEEEKNDRDAIAFGTNNVSYVVEQSACGTPMNLGGGFKVLERKPKAQIAHAPPITPFSTNALRQSRVRTVKEKEAEEDHQVCQVQIVADRLGRGTELISLINETDVPVSFTTPEEKANYALDTIRTHLEKMTEEKFMVHGFLAEKQWLFCGAENTLGEFSELRLEMKLVMTSPVNLQISAFSVRMERPNEKLTTLFTPTTVQLPMSNSSQPSRPADVPPTVREKSEKPPHPNAGSSLKKVTIKSTPTKDDKKVDQTIDNTVTGSGRQKIRKNKEKTLTSSKMKMTKKAQNTNLNAPPPSIRSLKSQQAQHASKNTPKGSMPNSPASSKHSNPMKMESGSAAAEVRRKLKEMASGKAFQKREDLPTESKEKTRAQILNVEKETGSALNSPNK